MNDESVVKIIHTADNHLGFRQYGLSQREEDFYLALDQVVETAIAQKVGAVLWSGDNFDATKPPAAAVERLKLATEKLRSHQILSLGIDGNHDSCDSTWLRICGITPLQGNQVMVYSRDRTRSLTVGGINATRPLEFHRQLELLNERSPIHVLAIHQALEELSGFSSDFTALTLSTSLAPLGVRYCAMGDIHKRGDLYIGNTIFAYPGSTEVNDTSEDSDKSVELVTFDGINLVHQPIPIKTRRFVVQTLESDEDVDTVLVRAKEPDKPFIVGWYRAEKREIGKRAEALLAAAGCMYRIMPFSGDKNLEVAKRSFDRKGAMTQLRDAVVAFFDEGSEEFSLIFQLLENPDNVKEIARKFLA